MEFKYRAINRKPTTMPYPFNPSLLQGSCGYSGYPTNTFGIPAAGDALWRKTEKGKIRREIIADEIEIERRKRQFEEEVRRELAVKRMQRYLAAPEPAPVPYSFQERLKPVAFDDMDTNFVRVSQSPLQDLVSPLEIKPYSPHIQYQKNKEIMLPRPKSIPDLSCAKRKAMAAAICDNESSASGLRKKAKKEWRCTLCQVNATSQKHLNKHLLGKKHKAKEEAAKKPQMIGLDAKGNRNSLPQPRFPLKELNQNMVEAKKSKNETQIVQQNLDDLKNQSEKDTKKAWKTKTSAA